MATPIRSPTRPTDIPTSVPYTAPKPRMPPIPTPVTNDVATPRGAVLTSSRTRSLATLVFGGPSGFTATSGRPRQPERLPARRTSTKLSGDPVPSSSWPRPYPAFPTSR